MEALPSRSIIVEENDTRARSDDQLAVFDTSSLRHSISQSASRPSSERPRPIFLACRSCPCILCVNLIPY